MQIPRRSFHLGANARTASLRLRDLPLVETFQFGGALAIAGQVSMDVLWQATGDPVERGEGASADPTSPAAFTGHFAEASCIGRVSGSETGFSFESGELTATTFFAEMGREQNGAFLTGVP